MRVMILVLTLGSLIGCGQFNGADGKDGQPGAPGKAPTVTVKPATLDECEYGGVVIEVDSKPAGIVCNGRNGENGRDGKDGQDADVPPVPDTGHYKCEKEHKDNGHNGKNK